MPSSDPQVGYAPVNGLSMYYEIHGSAIPPFLDAPMPEDP
jgi:hypothetical protein